MKKLKYVKLFENFQVNERFDDPNTELIQSIDNLIKYSKYKEGGELYAGQNSNFQQNLTADGKIIKRSEIKTPYCIGENDVLTCYNNNFPKNVSTDTILDEFNRIHKTNYKSISFPK